MVLIDFLNKTIPGGGQKKFFRASCEILPTLAKILCTRLLGWEGDLELRGFGLMKGKVVERDGVGR